MNSTMKTPDAWREIAMALAQTHVPAFQIEPAVRKYRKTKRTKPINLDVVGTAYFLIHDYLCEKEKEQPLTPFEKDLKESLDEELKALIANDSRRGLRRQMLSAWRDYWHGCANNFQRQFVEQVLPPTFDLFKKMDANRVTRTP